jgi:cell shape-determining protein MreC
MKKLLLFVALLCISSILYGFYIKDGQETTDGDFYIGIGTAVLFLVIMPVFIFTASKGKKMKDYTLSRENIEKMRENQEKR